MTPHDIVAVASAVAAVATVPHAQLRISENDAFAGPVTYRLTCGPAGGTLPRAARACRAIRRHPELLSDVAEGIPFPCPLGLPSFRVTGRYAGRRVDATFAACTSGQGPLADRWRRLVPSDLARTRVHVDRGIGLIRLAESEQRVAGLLGVGRSVTGARFYPSGMSMSYGNGPTFDVGFTVAYRARRAVAITATFPQTSVHGRMLADGFSALRHRLAGWQELACGAQERALAHGAGPATVVAFTRDSRRVTVQQAPPAC